MPQNLSKEEQRRSSGYTTFFRDKMKFQEEKVEKYRNALIAAGASSLEDFQCYIQDGYITEQILLQDAYGFQLLHTKKVLRTLKDDPQSHHRTSSLSITTSSKDSNLKDLYRSLGKAIVGNKQNNLDFSCFDTKFYLSEWWDQVYNFGWHFHRKENPWCQHLYFRKKIFERLGPDRLLESKEHEHMQVIMAVMTNASALKFASDELKSDLTFTIQVVNKNPLALEYAPEELKGDEI